MYCDSYTFIIQNIKRKVKPYLGGKYVREYCSSIWVHRESSAQSEKIKLHRPMY